MKVIAHQGDTVDALCQRHLGSTAVITEQVYATNPGIASLGPVLPMGTVIELPDQAPQKQNNTMIQLWD